MLSVLRFTLLLTAAAVMPMYASAQSKNVKPLVDNASLPETRKWLVEAIGKYASYKTPVTSASISDVKFEGCKVSFTLVRKTGTSGQDVMGVTRRTHTVKQETAFDLSFVEPEGIRLTDHIFPEFQMLTVRFRSGEPSTAPDREVEIVVKQEAAEHIRTALVHARRLCTTGN